MEKITIDVIKNLKQKIQGKWEKRWKALETSTTDSAKLNQVKDVWSKVLKVNIGEKGLSMLENPMYGKKLSEYLLSLNDLDIRLQLKQVIKKIASYVKQVKSASTLRRGIQNIDRIKDIPIYKTIHNSIANIDILLKKSKDPKKLTAP